MQNKIGFIGTGFIGSNMADDFKTRGFETIQYSLEENFVSNKDLLKDCDTVFIAVPTPTNDRKFDVSIIDNVIGSDTYAGQKIIIKSTVIAGTTERLQNIFKDRFFFHSAEFLTENNARKDVAYPSRNVVGYTDLSQKYAQEVMDLLPLSPHNILCRASESEMGKYMSNFLLTGKLILANIIYDLCQKYGIDYEVVKHIAETDNRIGKSHLQVIDEENQRGANGHCFPKDLSAVHEMYGDYMEEGNKLLEALEIYNMELNLQTGKDIDIIKEVFGLK